MGQTDYMIVGVEKTEESRRNNGHSLLWIPGRFVLNKHNLPTFTIHGHGMLDHSIMYAVHISGDAENRLIQLGWADETTKKQLVEAQGWAGCLGHLREISEVSRLLVPKET